MQMKILIVDDSPMTRRIVKNVIQEYAEREYELIEASDGLEALEKIRGAGISLILLDWNMPRLDGLQLVKRIRADGETAPIVMVTYVSDKEKLLEAGAAGVSEFIIKPIQGRDLWETIEQFLV